MPYAVVAVEMALFRPQFETCVRGTWYLHCASDAQVDAFVEGSEPPKIDNLLADIEALPGYGPGILAKLKDGT